MFMKVVTGLAVAGVVAGAYFTCRRREAERAAETPPIRLEQTECVICCDNLVNLGFVEDDPTREQLPELLVKLSPCLHTHHRTCLDKWVFPTGEPTRKWCPLCRIPMRFVDPTKPPPRMPKNQAANILCAGSYAIAGLATLGLFPRIV